MSLSADTYTYSHRPVAGVPIGNIPVEYTNYHVCKMSFRAIIDVLNIFKTSMRAMHDYSLGAFRKHAKSRTGHNADIYDTWHGRVQCIRFR